MREVGMSWYTVNVTAQIQVPPTLEWFPRPFEVVTGYAFETQGTQHLNYRGFGRPFDNSIYELWWDSSGWHLNNLSEAVGGVPSPPAGDPKGYAFEAQGTQHVNYRGEDGNIYELWCDSNGGWHLNPLSKTTGGAPSPAAGDPKGYAFEAQGTQHVNYRGEDGNIYELWWDSSGWHLNPLSKAVGGVPSPPAGNPEGYAFEAEGTQHVNYRGEDGNIYELWCDSNGGWHLNPLSKTTGGAPSPAAGDPKGYAFEAQGTQHVNYRGEDGK